MCDCKTSEFFACKDLSDQIVPLDVKDIPHGRATYSHNKTVGACVMINMIGWYHYDNCDIMLWHTSDLDTENKAVRIHHERHIVSIALSGDGKYLFVCDAVRLLTKYSIGDLCDIKAVSSFLPNEKFFLWPMLPTSDGKYIAGGPHKGTMDDFNVYVYNTEDWCLHKTFSLLTTEVRRLRYTDSCDMVYSSDFNNNAYEWRIADGECSACKVECVDRIGE